MIEKAKIYAFIYLKDFLTAFPALKAVVFYSMQNTIQTKMNKNIAFNAFFTWILEKVAWIKKMRVASCQSPNLFFTLQLKAPKK